PARPRTAPTTIEVRVVANDEHIPLPRLYSRHIAQCAVGQRAARLTEIPGDLLVCDRFVVSERAIVPVPWHNALRCEDRFGAIAQSAFDRSWIRGRRPILQEDAEGIRGPGRPAGREEEPLTGVVGAAQGSEQETDRPGTGPKGSVVVAAAAEEVVVH